MPKLTLRRSLLLALLATLAGCGGSGGGNEDAALVAAAIAAPCSTAFDPVQLQSTTVAKSLKDSVPLTPLIVPLSQCALDANRNVTIGGGGCGPNVLIDRSFSGASALGRITIAADGKLAVPSSFDDIELDTTGIDVSGLLSVGTAQCPVGKNNPTSRFKMVFIGQDDSTNTGDIGTGYDKGIQVESGGILRLYGAKGVAPTGVNWTVLSAPAGPAAYQATDRGIAAPVAAGGETTLHLAKDVTTGGAWRPGDWIVVATTSFSPFESEFVQIGSVKPDGAGGSVVTLVQPLRHYHFGGADPGLPSAANYGAGTATNFGVDERAEVGLISRNIQLTAQTPDPSVDPNDPNLHWGGEIRILAGFAETSIQGVELEKFGKARLGSYPIHFHMAGDASTHVELVDSNSIHHSFNKCVTVHSTTNVAVDNNVCARAVGHLFYEEMGMEQGTRFVGNLGVGAMSNNFGLDASVPKTPDGLVKDYWEGDNLAKFNLYDGLNVPDTGNQAAPSHGRCFNAGGQATLNSDPPCKAGTFYAEQSSGFWLVNPGTVVQGNSIAGCQGMGKAYWYVPPPGDPAAFPQRFEPVGSFTNNRAHGCYDGLFGETDIAAVTQQLFPTVGGKTTSDPSSVNLIGHFDSFTATRIRNRGVWMRPVWTALENSRFATNRDAVSLVSSGGNDGNAPGVWALLKDSVLVGVSNNNVDRWGPCPTPAPGNGQGCVDYNPKANEIYELAYQTPRWNSAGYMIYDGPVRIIHDHFVNYLKDPTPLLTLDDQATIQAFRAWPDPATTKYEGDAALGWFQNNQSAYPTATVSKALSYDNVDLRHQIYTEHVNLGDFRDGDKNTAIIDLDGSLTGFKVVDSTGAPVADEYPISLNNLPFNHAANAADECLSTGQQDAVFENRPTSIISPANMATLEFEGQYPLPQTWQNMVFTKDSLDAGVHQSMALLSRNAQGIWEPKVASGSGYTVQTAPTTAPGIAPIPPQGMPAVVRVGFTDAVKPHMDQKPFYVRLGVCYSNAQGQPPAANFTITKGYKSWGGNGVSYNNPALQAYFNFLSNRYQGQNCFNLDNQNSANLASGTGCPAEGVTPVPAGGACPAPSTLDPTANVCVYPRTTLTAAASIGELTNPDGTPADVNKYFYDSTTGMLFMYVLQDANNAHGVAPLGSCTGQPGDDPACPDSTELDTYYSCPPQGCINYSINLNDPSYQPGPSQCAALAGGTLYGPNGYTLPEPPAPYKLAYVNADGSTGGVVNPTVQNATGSKGTFTHWVPDQTPSCAITTPTSALNPVVASADVSTGAALRARAFDLVQWLRGGMASALADNVPGDARGRKRWTPDGFTGNRRAIPDISAMTQICTATPS